MRRTRHIIALAAAVLALACSRKEDAAGDSCPLVVYASIEGTGSAHTRAASTEIDDLWSYVSFEHGDKMGIYASGGNWMEQGGSGAFDNFPLSYDAGRGQFNDENGSVFSPSHMNSSEIYIYYPFGPDMSGGGSGGLELRSLVPEDGVDDQVSTPYDKTRHLRCMDFLSANTITLEGRKDNSDMALYGSFQHSFSELIIMRGEGFDSPPPGKERITAVLNTACTHIKVDFSASPWRCTPSLVYSGSNSFGLSEQDAYRWNAWRGGNYGITVSPEPGESKEGEPAWYIIVPTLKNANTIVQYIELYDNEGYLQRVSSLLLKGGNSKYAEPGWRYPMEITMKELVPTVNPFPIAPWGENVDLTDERTRGINNEIEFAQWVLAYNLWLLDQQSEEKTNALLKYGDLTVDAGGQNPSWHFYVLSDLDLDKYTPQTSDGLPAVEGLIIPHLSDILDGQSTNFVNGKFTNHTISGLSKTFVGLLDGNGSIQNFDFIGPYVVNDETHSDVAGIIVNEMRETSVINCNVEDGTLVNLGGPAGIVAGSIFGGQVKNCTLEGFLAAGGTAGAPAAKIVGRIDGGAPVFENNDADAVISGRQP